MKKLYYIIISICIFISILISSIFITTYNKSFYIKQFHINNTYENSMVLSRNINPEFIATEVIDYLKGNIYNLNRSGIFTNEEIIHMKDVKNLFIASKYTFILLIAAIIILTAVYIIKKHSIYDFLKNIVKYFILTSIIIIGILFIAFLNFSESFTTFHEILFTNDYWLLDPNTSIIINIMPENFFMAHAANIGLIFSIISFIILIFIIILMKLIKGRKNNVKF